MSTDYFLYAPSLNLKAMIGSIGMSGAKAWSNYHHAMDLLHYAIDKLAADDLVIVDENRMDALEEQKGLAVRYFCDFFDAPGEDCEIRRPTKEVITTGADPDEYP